ncbi:MAG: GNAT family N-acetyltransferase [Balneolaceae bacterium]|nr:GNAT family N-acetyltransferase [Balneolaceae bacterium]
MAKKRITLDDITIRTRLKPGDIGRITYLHGILYSRHYNHNIHFEAYVAKGLAEFYFNYNPKKDRAWLCEHKEELIGSIVLQHREEKAQLRYFLIHPDYRGIGLGKTLMKLYMEYLKEKNYKEAFLLTTRELSAASSLYKRHGFFLSDEKPTEDFGKPMILQRYVWKAG